MPVYRLCIAFAVQSVAATFPIPVLSRCRALPLNALGFPAGTVPAAVGLLIGSLLPKKTEKA